MFEFSSLKMVALTFGIGEDDDQSYEFLRSYILMVSL